MSRARSAHNLLTSARDPSVAILLGIANLEAVPKVGDMEHCPFALTKEEITLW
jgi:hypothetical protein